MKKGITCFLLTITAALLCSISANAQPKPRFHVLALYENGGHHIEYSKAAKIWLNKLAADSGFTIDYITDTKTINDSTLAQYQLFLQLDFVPYGWTATAQQAFTQYIERGKGGWVGFHHASLLGEFDGYPMWPWFHQFIGGIRFKNYIASFAQADVQVEDKQHPVMRGVPPVFPINKDEWYTYDTTPRPNVHVIACVDEKSYKPSSNIVMGDHPVIWTNEHVAARNIYIFMGHSPDLFDNAAYTTIFRNAIFWAVER